MILNNDIITVIKNNLNKNSEFEFIVGLEDLTLSDIGFIEKMFAIKSKLNYQIVDNIYIKISFSSYAGIVNA